MSELYCETQNQPGPQASLMINNPGADGLDQPGIILYTGPP